MEHKTPKDSFLKLPMGVVGRVDVGRLRREVEAIDSFLAQAAIREPGTPMKLPKTSRLVDETIEANGLNMLVEDDRNRLVHFLMEVYAHAPTIHISFSADPSPNFTARLIRWLREEIHPLILLQIGLQPSIGAGCVVRTTNKYFDLSLKHKFAEQSKELGEYLRQLAVDPTAKKGAVAATTMPSGPAVVATTPLAVTAAPAGPAPAATPVAAIHTGAQHE